MKASCYQMLSCICLSALRYWLWSLWGDEPAWEASCASQRASKLHLQLEYREEETNQNFQRQHAGGTVSYNFHSCKHLQWGNSAARTLGNCKQIATDCWELTIQTYKPLFFLYLPGAVLGPEDSAVTKTRSLPSENLHWSTEDRWLTTKQVGTRVPPLYPRSPTDAWNHR